MIDADALKKELSGFNYDMALRIVDTQPTIESQPVRHGRWIALEGWFNKSNVKCSICGNTLNMNGVNAGRGDANFCPNCGADMREGGEQE